MEPTKPFQAWIPLLAALLTACGGGGSGGLPASSPEDAPTTTEGATRKGTYGVAWHPEGGDIPLNEPFALEILLTRGGDPVEGATLNVRCDMPAHGHGMNVVPVVEELGEGRYRADGLVLHMRGEWVLGVDVVVDAIAETADFPLLLE